jgi:AraC-like DNA-binding protein
VRFARPLQLPGLELVHYPSLTRGWRGIPEAYTWFTMIDWLEGDVEVLSRGMRAQCEPGSVTIGEPGDPYALRSHSAMRGEFRVIRVDYDLLQAIAEEVGGRRGGTRFPREPQRDPALAHAFAHLYRSIDRDDRLDAQERLYAFLSALLAHGPEPPVQAAASTNTPVVRRARELLHAGLDTSLSLDELADAAGTDKFALLRTFSAELGITPHAYQVQLRVARACRLIARGAPLADVALSVGYSEQSALHRPFKRLVGVSPGAYARAVR